MKTLRLSHENIHKILMCFSFIVDVFCYYNPNHWYSQCTCKKWEKTRMKRKKSCLETNKTCLTLVMPSWYVGCKFLQLNVSAKNSTRKKRALRLKLESTIYLPQDLDFSFFNLNKGFGIVIYVSGQTNRQSLLVVASIHFVACFYYICNL